MENTTQQLEATSITEAKRQVDVLLGVKPNNIPTKISRNKFGLMESLNYIFKEDGYIDWKRMVPKEFLYLNPERKVQIEKKYNKTINEIDVSEADERDLVITLGGLKYLLKIRGYNYIDYTIKEANENYVAIMCLISFIGSYETEDREISFSDCACAHFNNTKSFAKKYLVEIATNRAFCRTVRNFLGINIVSQEELGETNNIEESSKNDEADNLLQRVMEQNNITFGKVKNRLIEDGYINKNLNPPLEAKDIVSIQQIDMVTQFKLIERIKNKIKELNK